MMGIEQKVAVITGASRGIGAALVRAYQDRNYRIVATARSISPAKDTDVVVVQGDIAERKTAERVIADGLERFGRIDTLINNAGILISKPFTQYTEDDYAAIIGANTAGFFNITQFAVREMQKQGSGHVVQITSSLADLGNSQLPAALVALTKGGLNAATRSLAVEYAKSGIRVNAVSLGMIKSTQEIHSPEALAAVNSVERMGTIADIVDAVLYLESASFVTGEILHVDGGQSAGR
jgi:NAD(P)-dependent dehydrogenase (short-subunit alcohol dehydrogenase family)